MGMDTNQRLVSRFVDTLNSRGFEPLFGNEVPEELRTNELPDAPDLYNWQIRPASDNPSVTSLQSLLPCPLPESFLLFISKYRFAEFEVGSVKFFGNTGSDNNHDLSRA